MNPTRLKPTLSEYPFEARDPLESRSRALPGVQAAFAVPHSGSTGI
jgi:hypothetical protein